MSAMARRYLLAVFLAGILASVFVSVRSAHGQDVKQYLRDQYQDKIFVLRGFPAGAVLRYDSSGAPENAASGDWTSDGFVQVNEIRISDDRLMIRAQRMAVIWSDKRQFELRALVRPKSNNKDTEPIQVKISADPRMHNPSPEQIDAVAAKIFLTAQDSLADLVPDYWKPCVSGGLKGKDEKCVFASEMLNVPGVATPGAGDTSAASGADGELNRGSNGIFKIGHGVRAPHVISQHNPEFSDVARMAKYQGTVALSLIVDKDGVPNNIRITQPLGYGLDAKAVEAVQSWKFDPAEKDGQPVPVEIAVEVDFHLY